MPLDVRDPTRKVKEGEICLAGPVRAPLGGELLGRVPQAAALRRLSAMVTSPPLVHKPFHRGCC